MWGHKGVRHTYICILCGFDGFTLMFRVFTTCLYLYCMSFWQLLKIMLKWKFGMLSTMVCMLKSIWSKQEQIVIHHTKDTVIKLFWVCAIILLGFLRTASRRHSISRRSTLKLTNDGVSSTERTIDTDSGGI